MNKQMTKWNRGIVVVAWLCSVSSVLADPAVTYRRVAYRGESAPGVEPGITWDFFSLPLIDDYGHVAIKGIMTGPGVTSSNNEGFWTEVETGWMLWAREGSQAPDVEPGTSFGSFVNNPFAPLGGDGSVGFRANIQGPNIPTGAYTAIWSIESSAMRVAMRRNDAAPGYAPGAQIRTLNVPSVASGGALGIVTEVYNPESSTPLYLEQAVYSYNGSLSLVARQNDPAPGAGFGDYFLGFYPLSLKPDGSSGVLFKAEFGGPTDGGNGLWLHANNNLSPLAITGTPAMGLPSTYLTGSILTEVNPLNNSGETAFKAHSYEPMPPYGSAIGIFAGGVSSLRSVIKEHDPAPGLSAGIRIGSLSGYFIPIDGSGRVAFHADLEGSGITLSNDDSIFAEREDGIHLVAREGNHAPGMPDGVSFTGFGSEIDMNSLGQIAFRAGVSGPGVSGDSLWAQDSNGTLHLIVGNGMLLEVAPGDVRTVSYFDYMGNRYGGSTYGRAFNDRGELTFIVGFTDGSRDIFVARVPEPSSALLYIALIAIGIHRRRFTNRA